MLESYLPIKRRFDSYKFAKACEIISENDIG